MIVLQDKDRVSGTEYYVQEVNFRDTVGMSLVVDAKVKGYKVNAVNKKSNPNMISSLIGAIYIQSNDITYLKA